MKKILAIFLALLILSTLLLISCANGKDSIDTSDSTEAIEAETTALTTVKDAQTSAAESSRSETETESETTSAATESSETTSADTESSETTSDETVPESMTGGEEFKNDNEADYKDEWQ